MAARAGLIIVFVAARLALAEGAPPLVSPGARPARTEVARARPVERSLVSSSSQVSASDALDEMLDELGADVARTGAVQLSPVLIDRVRVSEGLNPQFARVLEARLVAALLRAAAVDVLRCAECWATHGEVHDGAWNVRRGITTLEEQKRLAQVYGARTLLSATLSLQESTQSLALDVQIVRADTSQITFAESYRFVAGEALLYRGADRAQYREERLRDLEQRMDARPQFGHQLVLGTMWVPLKHDGVEESVRGAVGSYRLYEKFGDERQYRAGFSLGGFLNDSQFAGAILTANLAVRLTGESAFLPSLHLGLAAGAFVTGNAGNSSLAEVSFETLLVHRIGLHAGLGYVLPFELKKRGTVGGMSPGAGVVISW